MRKIILVIVCVIASTPTFAQKFFTETANFGLDYGYNMYYKNTSTILDGINIGGRITKMLSVDEHDAFHIGAKFAYHSRNLLSEFGQLKQRSAELGAFAGWNDNGDQTYLSGRYSYLIGENVHLLGLEVRIEPFDKFIYEDIELMFYGSPHLLLKNKQASSVGITLGIGIVYHIIKKEIINSEIFYNYGNN